MTDRIGEAGERSGAVRSFPLPHHDPHRVSSGLASALDADTDGVEGRFYAWTPGELVEVLGEKDGAWAASLLSVTDEGTFEHGTSTLQLREDLGVHLRLEQREARLAVALRPIHRHIGVAEELARRQVA